MRSIPKRSLALLSILCVLSLCGCREPYPHPRFQGHGNRTPVRGGILRFAFDTDVRVLDPHTAYDELSSAPVRMLFDTLVDYRIGTTELEPVLAERWERSANGREYTFYLRRNVRFHNGQAFTANDVVASFERMLDPRKVPCPGTSFYLSIEGVADFQEQRAPHVRGLQRIDDYTIKFVLTRPDPTFLYALAMPFAAPVPVNVTERVGRDGFGEAPVGTGPFMLDRWEVGSRIVLRRNPYYWRAGLPYLDGIVIETGIARHLQFMRFQRGDLDYLHSTSLGTADLIWLKQHPAWRALLREEPDISMYGLAMNTEVAPWNNVHLRRAVAYALDREAISSARNARIRPLGGIYPPGLPGYDPALPGGQRYDIEAARREMALAGYPNGLPDEHELWLTEGEVGLVYGQLLQADLARIGIRVRIRQASFAVFLDTTQRRRAVGLSLSAWSQDFPDPSNFIDTLFHSRSILEEHSQNVSFYRNPALDALLDQARTEPDATQRIEMYRRAERMVVQDAPWGFMFYTVNAEAVQPYVRGYQHNPVFKHDMRSVWLDLPTRAWSAP